MANRKKLLTSAIALTTAAALTLGGTFAWQSISQGALNEASDDVNPGGRLHNDQHWVSAKENDNNIYVENFEEDAIFARVRLSEYMEVIMNYGVKDAEVVEVVVGSKELVNVSEDDPDDLDSNSPTQQNKFDYKYTVHDFAKDVEGAEETNPTSKFLTWKTGKTLEADGNAVENAEKPYYIPTFNMNKDSLLADLNGKYKVAIGGISERREEQYTYTKVDADSTKNAWEVWDGDYNSADELSQEQLEQLIESGAEAACYQEVAEYVALSEEKVDHAAKQVGDTKGLISMTEWLELAATEGYQENGVLTQAGQEALYGYWVYDKDGWVYWSAPIEGHSATGLLLDGFTLNGVMDDTWYYAIEVESQFVTADDVGKGDKSGFYDTDTNSDPTVKAEKLLKLIGVDLEVSPKALTISDPKLTDSSDGNLIITATAKVNNEPAADTTEQAVNGYLGENKDDISAIKGAIKDGMVTFKIDGSQFWSGQAEQYYLHTDLDLAIGYTDEDGDALTSNTLNLKYADELKLNADGTGTITLTEDGLKRFAVTTSEGDVTPNITVSTADDTQLTEDTDFKYDMFAGRLVIKGDSYVGQTLTVAEYIEPKAISVDFTHNGQSANYSTDFKVGTEDTLTVSFTNKWNQQIVDKEDVAAIMANAEFTLMDGEDTVTKGGEYGWKWEVEGSDVKITIDQDYIDKLTLKYSIPGYDGSGNEYTHQGEIELTPDFTDVYGAKEVNLLKLGMNGSVYPSATMATATANLNEDYWIYCDELGYGTRWMETKSDWFKDGVITSNKATVQYSADDPGNQIGVSGTTVTFAEGTGTCNDEAVCTQERTDTRCQKITFTKEGYFILKFTVGNDRGDNFAVVVEVN